MLVGIVPAKDEEAFPILRGIDPFGNTVFNHLQAAEFLEEWERVKERARDDSQRTVWQKIKEMAESCCEDRDLFLRFVGN